MIGKIEKNLFSFLRSKKAAHLKNQDKRRKKERDPDPELKMRETKHGSQKMENSSSS